MMDNYEKNTGFESETTIDDKMSLFRLRELSGQGNTEARIIMGKKYLKQTIHIQRVKKRITTLFWIESIFVLYYLKGKYKGERR